MEVIILSLYLNLVERFIYSYLIELVMGWKDKSKSSALKRGLIAAGFIVAAASSYLSFPSSGPAPLQSSSNVQVSSSIQAPTKPQLSPAKKAAILAAEKAYIKGHSKLATNCANNKKVDFKDCMGGYIDIAGNYIVALKEARINEFSEVVFNDMQNANLVILDHLGDILANNEDSWTDELEEKVDSFYHMIKAIDDAMSAFRERAEVEEIAIEEPTGEVLTRKVITIDGGMQAALNKWAKFAGAMFFALMFALYAGVEVKEGLFARTKKEKKVKEKKAKKVKSPKIKDSERAKRVKESIARGRDSAIRFIKKTRTIEFKKMEFKRIAPNFRGGLGFRRKNKPAKGALSADALRRVSKLFQDAATFNTDLKRFNDGFLAGDTSAEIWQLRFTLKEEAARLEREWFLDVKPLMPEWDDSEQMDTMIREAVDSVASF
jgi:hypothetical protein